MIRSSRPEGGFQSIPELNRAADHFGIGTNSNRNSVPEEILIKQLSKLRMDLHLVTFNGKPKSLVIKLVPESVIPLDFPALLDAMEQFASDKLLG